MIGRKRTFLEKNHWENNLLKNVAIWKHLFLSELYSFTSETKMPDNPTTINKYPRKALKNNTTNNPQATAKPLAM